MDIVFRILEITVAFLGVLGICLIGLALMGFVNLQKRRSKPSAEGFLTITSLSEKATEQDTSLQEVLLSKSQFKSLEKKLKKQEEELEKKEKSQNTEGSDNPKEFGPKSRVFVMDFDGDIHAHQTTQLGKTIDALLRISKPFDRCILRLESPGGVVHGYGLAAAQLQRITNAGLELWICVDKIAASGGYMMACVGQKIFAAPFAVLGSIGVVASFPNFHRVLKKWDVDYLELTAGEFKRTLTPLGEVTPQKQSKFVLQLEETHELFKQHVTQCRPQVLADKVTTGEHWYGKQCLDLGLVDAIQTSNEVIEPFLSTHKVFLFGWEEPKDWRKKLGSFVRAVYQKWVFPV
jgi:serine protease SohB